MNKCNYIKITRNSLNLTGDILDKLVFKKPADMF